MRKNYEDSLFTQLTDEESATVSGAGITAGVSGSSNSSDVSNNTDKGLNLLLFVPQPGELYLYDPIRQRPYKTLVV
ncbi:secretion protein HlyD [Microcoleus sp. herbarium19]|uniref:secretion protein HlyD n=1 Tax=unclassified Microcoleus TaxID=2642155 RepID=UPI002FD6CDA1